MISYTLFQLLFHFALQGVKYGGKVLQLVYTFLFTTIDNYGKL